MPCNSDYLAPNGREYELQHAAQLLEYALETLGRPVEAWVRAQAQNIYAKDDRAVIQLCDLLRALPTAQRDKLVYNARNQMARGLADWWEAHQAADEAREQREAEDDERKLVREIALSKLTYAEKRALGLAP